MNQHPNRSATLDHIRQDIAYALRSLLRAPGFSVAVLIVLALGIGANAAIFTVVDAVLLKPLPYPDADRLVMVSHVPPQTTFRGVPRFPVSPANYLDWQQRQHSFERMAVVQPGGMVLTGRGEPAQLQVNSVSTGFFDLLGLAMEAGRSFRPGEDEPGRGRVAILGHALWKTRFGSDQSIIGHTLLLDGAPYEIVGIADPAYDARPLSGQVWIPLAWSPAMRVNRGGHFLLTFARLRPGVTIEQANAEMTAISQTLERDYPDDNKNWGATVEPLKETLVVGDRRLTLLVLLGAVGFVLLIACANVANLILVRAIARRPEMAVRLALGATPWRVSRLVLTESTLLGLAAGGLGLGVSHVGIGLLALVLGPRFPEAATLEPGVRVILFTMGVSLLAGVGAGLWPALRLARASLSGAIKKGGDRGDSDASGPFVRNMLVVAEVALSLVLLIGAGLMIRTMWQLNAVDTGIDSRNVITASVSLPMARYPRGDQRRAFYEDVLTRVKALPDVESAAVVRTLPLFNGSMFNSWPVAVVGRAPVPLAEQPNVHGNIVSPQYFQTMRIPLVRGRAFSEADQFDRPAVVIISEAMARLLWPDENPIGQHVLLAFFPNAPSREVIGVVKDIKEDGLIRGGSAALYMPMAQWPVPVGTFVVRTRTPLPAHIGPALEAAVHAVDGDRPVNDVMTMEAVVAQSFADRRGTMLLLATFATLALILASVGIYSVLAYGVRRRVREIGIRIALGADRGMVTRMIVADALRPTLIGIGLGLAGAIALRQVMATLVFGVSASDPVTFGAIAALFVVVALGASALPAYWATHVDPNLALRAD